MVNKFSKALINTAAQGTAVWMSGMKWFWKEWGFSTIVSALWLAAAFAYVVAPLDVESEAQPGVSATTPSGTRATAPSHAESRQSGVDVQQARHVFKMLALTAAVAAIAWFAYAFTGDPFQQRSQAVRFSYFFVIASFAALAIPPLVKSQAIGTEPLGIISGCIRQTESEQLRCRPARPSANKKDLAQNPVNDQPKQEQQQAPLDTTQATGMTSEEKPQDEIRNQWLVNIGGALEPQKTCDRRKPECKPGSSTNRAYITGGIVVPLPYVIIAMFGGAISLSRRVPEIQKRSEEYYISTGLDFKLQPGEVREQLAFQILQFISAPLIAITAYQVIEPERQATAVALAFMSGFGSETILLLIRGVVTGVQPKNAIPMGASTGAVTGIVTEAGKPVAGVIVGIARGNSKAKTDQDGRYLLLDIPPGPRDIIVSEPNRSGKSTVTVVTGQTATCDVTLKSTGTITGTVTDAQEQKYVGTKVYLVTLPSCATTTGKDGTFRLEHVPIGEQSIVAEHIAGAAKLYGTTQLTVEIGKTTQCNILIAGA